MSPKSYLDYAGLERYNAKIQSQLEDKVNSEVGKGLSTNDFTTPEKEKLEGLKNYTLPVSSEETLGGVKIATTENPVPATTGLKAGADGSAFVDWAQAPMASTSDPGMVKLGGTFKLNEDGSVDVDGAKVTAGGIDWENINNKPDLATKADMTSVYKYKGSVETFEALPTEALTVGDVYNVEATGMNYAWTGIEWDALGEIFEISTITEAQIDALFEGDTNEQ